MKLPRIYRLQLVWLSFLALSAGGTSFLTACSTGRRAPSPDLTAAGVVRDGVSNEKDTETVVILGTNDIHGALAPIEFKTKDSRAVTYRKGGAVILDRHVQILRQQYGDHFIWLDGGDEFQGSIESNVAEGKPMVSFFNEAGLTAAAIGNHEFDFGPVGPEGTPGDVEGALKARMSEAKYPYLAANIIERATGKPPEWPNFKPSLTVKVGGLKVGIIGLSTEETPTTTRIENVRQLVFQSLHDATMREAKNLRTAGAQLVVDQAQSGLRCTPLEVPLTHRLRAAGDAAGTCGSGGEMVKLLSSLPKGTVDGVVSGHSHTIVHHWINGVPVVQGGSRGHDYNLLYLTYDWKTHQARPELSRIEGPIPVCPKVFANQADCNGERPAPARVGRGKLVNASLRGEKIEPSPRMEQLLEPTFAASQKERKRVVGKAARELAHEKTQESPLGNLIADALRWKLKTDIAIINTGGIRAPIEAGDISYEQLFRTLPFDNFVSEVRVTGKELKKLVDISQSGYRGFFPTSGLHITALDATLDAPLRDLNQDGKKEPWEADRVVSVRLANGTQIDDKKMYSVATIDFLVNGGDDWLWIMSQIPNDQKTVTAGPLVRDVVEEYLAQAGKVNAKENPLVSTLSPRLTITRFMPRHGTKRHRSRKRR